LEHHFPITRTARYQQLGTVSAGTRRVWLVLHGYGQLAAYFVRHFAALHAADPVGTLILAPEGLSRFYLQGNGGRVGASWMTSDDRLSEIADYLAYLNQLTNSVLAELPASADLFVLGFSQGAATASRWLAQATRRPARLILWAGAFPQDMDLAQTRALLDEVPVTVVVGDADEYISEAHVEQHLARLREVGYAPELLRFRGGHTLDAGVLARLAES